MAKGMKCPQCGHSMFAKKEVVKPAGTDVTYHCNSCKFELRKFEDK